MSRFFSSKYDSLEPYTPGEQPKEKKYIKLNTNESPFEPSPEAVRMAREAVNNLQLYSDPECRQAVNAIAEHFGVSNDEVIVTNGSDEVLNFAFMAFCDSKNGVAFPDITYGFYPVFADLNGIPYDKIPLDKDFNINIEDYIGINKTIFIANPNAPTGIALKKEEIEKIIVSNPDNVIVIDEAYVDFGAESCVSLINKYDNLLVTQTFSKSRSLAGGRLGFGIASRQLIADLNTIRFSTNPYNVNSMTLAAGIGAIKDTEYMLSNCKTIIENREYTAAALKKMGFEQTDSFANFIFAKHPCYDGERLYLKLKERGILVRHFSLERIAQYNRITIGTLEQMKQLITAIKAILEEEK